MPNPLDEALQASEKYASEVRQKKHQGDLQAVQTWQKSKTPENLAASMKRHEPLVNIYLAKYVAPGVNQEAARGELQFLAFKAHQSYDPKYKTTFQTHLENEMKHIRRFNERAQNMARIPPEQQKYIGPLDTAKAALHDEHSREPTYTEIHDWLKQNPYVWGEKKPITAKKLEQLDKLRRRDIMSGSLERDTLSHVPSLDRQHFPLIRETLTPRGQTVFDHLYGYNGVPQAKSKGEIAKKTGLQAPVVSREITRMAAKYNQFFK